MKNLRRWQLDSSSPYVLRLAADARLSPTDYSDDQVWELSLGELESPALVLQTRYGGRAGLASLIPMWFHEGRSVYQGNAYAKPPYITAFAPGYLRIQATITLQLALQAEYWVMESHAIGGRFTLANARVEPASVHLDLLGQVGMGGKEQPVRILALPDGSSALHLGKIGNLRPVVVLENATADTSGVYVSPKISRDLTIEGRKKVEIRWVHAALPDAAASLALAQRWLSQDWQAAFDRIDQAALAIPIIETGDSDQDAALAFAWQELMYAFLKPTAHLPHASFVAVRHPARGYSPTADYADRAWSGQNPTLAYPTALAAASIHPEIAQGVVRNYLAVQQADGWIDWRPGLGGQRQGVLCLPILARLAWGIFQYTDDASFLRDVFPGLLKFFERWLQPDLDADNDGLPEWQSEQQTGYVYMPTFATWQTWGQKADIRLVETPDLLAYLLSEAKSLQAIAYFLRANEAEARLTDHVTRLQVALESLWQLDQNRYVYRDRDTHITTASAPVLAETPADQELLPAQKLSPPNRLILHVIGGVNLAPRMTLKLEGLDQDGHPLVETLTGDQFVWSTGHGAYTTRSVFSQLDRLTVEGLSRVYRISINTLDTTRLDINHLLPLWSVALPDDRTRALIALLTQADHFWRPNGISMSSAQDPTFDPSNADGGGGVWPFWVTLLGEGLIETGKLDKAAELLQRLLAVQIAVLKTEKTFTEFYHSDEPRGLGERGYLGGLIPLHLFLRVLGVRIVSSTKVWTGGPYVWPQPVTIRQHGVTVERRSDGTKITFPSGHRSDIPPGDWQEIIDPIGISADSDSSDGH